MVVGVKEARVYDLGRELHDGIPVFPGRYFKQTLAPNAGPPLGENEVDWSIELVTATMQVGTHLDALCHLRRGATGHDGWSLRRDTTPEGATRLGIETAPQFATTGWLVEARDEHVIGVDALEGIEPEPGDAVFFHTGHGRHWDDPKAYLAGEPGPGMEVARWLVDRRVALTGCDTWSYGPVPPEDPARPFEVPQFLNVDHGVYVVENLDLRELAADGVRRFALVLTFPKLRGATGAWCTPIALV
ncbi:MAG TPA: cyclase family protein [Solirubrobacteraceae bacterium]|nr:cyclase family protein [Solirubrobacteraceae bacterium]